jgi:hypothetical protein
MRRRCALRFGKAKSPRFLEGIVRSGPTYLYGGMVVGPLENLLNWLLRTTKCWPYARRG